MWLIFELALWGVVIMIALWLGQLLLTLCFGIICFVLEILGKIIEKIKGE